MKASARRAATAARTRQDLLEAAGRAFARRGLEKATVQDIAREAGYTAAALYTYFKGKDEIVTALGCTITDEALATFDTDVSSGRSLAARLELLVRAQLAFADRRRDVLAAFVMHPHTGHDRRAAREAGFPGLVERMTAWLTRHGGASEPGGLAVKDAALFVVGVTQAFFMRWLLEGARTPLVDESSKVVDLVLHGLQAGRARRR